MFVYDSMKYMFVSTLYIDSACLSPAMACIEVSAVSITATCCSLKVLLYVCMAYSLSI